MRGEPYLCLTHVIAAYLEPRFLAGDRLDDLDVIRQIVIHD